MPRLTRLLLPLSLAACVADAPPEVGVTAQANLVVPDSAKCNQGAGPGKCVQVPPVAATSLARWVTDGVAAPLEYHGATEIPYTLDTPSLGGFGKLRLQRISLEDANGNVSRRFLAVHFDALTVPASNQGTVPMSKFLVRLDHERFVGPTKYIAGADRQLVLDFSTGVVGVQQPLNGDTAAASWQAAPAISGLRFRAGGCSKDAASKWRCSAELLLPLPASVDAAPGANLAPGMGFLLRHIEVTGSAPEIGLNQYTAATNTRTLWQSLLFTRPRGIALKVMSWNVNRPEDPDDGFEKASDNEIGYFLADHDVVALQEGWDTKRVEAILAGANTKRAADGKPLFYLYGSTTFSPAFGNVIASLNAMFSPQTHGGLWVMSPFEMGRDGQHVFSSAACRGADCLRAKGVQWVRLLINPQELADPACVDGRGVGCQKLPSGDDYLDVFNVNLQSDDPGYCLDGSWPEVQAALLGVLSEIPVVGWIAAALDTVITLVQDDLNCTNTTDAGIRGAQLFEAGIFIQAAVGASDRPAFVVGDFNINGRDITTPAYRQMLAQLGITSLGQPDDNISPLPGSFDWVVEHGDLARERDDLDFASGMCLGTQIYNVLGFPNAACPNDGNFDGIERTSYILVRPPVIAELAATKPDPRWVMATSDLPYAAPFPTLTGTFGGPPDRLSDHKPVVADIEMVPLASPPKYHAKWNHKLELRLTSVNATNQEDCGSCGEVDPFADLDTWEFPGSNFIHHTNECTDNFHPTWKVHSCMDNWFVERTQVLGITAVDLRSSVWEDNTSSSNDKISNFVRSNFRFDVGGEGLYEFYGVEPFTQNVLTATPWIVFDTEPRERCDTPLAAQSTIYAAQARVCHRIAITELPPGP